MEVEGKKAMDGKSIMDQERPLLAFLSSLRRWTMVIHYNGTEIKTMLKAFSRGHPMRNVFNEIKQKSF